MTATRTLIASAVLALLACGAPGSWAQAEADPPRTEWPLAQETPVFEAPVDPPKEPLDRTPPPDPQGPLTLSDALALALLRNPELEMFAWDVRASEARTLQAGKIPNPEVDVRLYNLGRPEAESDVGRNRIILSEVFELGSKRKRRVTFAETEEAIANLDYEAKRLDVASRVGARFVEVLGAQRIVEAMRRQVSFFEETAELVDALIGRGTVRGVEAHQVQRRLGMARIDLQAAENELGAARYRLAALWGSTSPGFTDATGDLEQVRFLPALEAVIALAEQNPDVVRWQREWERNRAALSVARSERIPDLEVGVGMRWRDDRPEKDYLLDLEISIPLADRKQGDIRSAKFGMARAEAGREATAAANAEAVAELYYELTEAETRRTMLIEHVIPSAQSAVEGLRLGFATTGRDMNDLLDARRDLARAEADYEEALVDYHRALAGLERLVGDSLGTAP